MVALSTCVVYGGSITISGFARSNSGQTTINAGGGAYTVGDSVSDAGSSPGGLTGLRNSLSTYSAFGSFSQLSGAFTADTFNFDSPGSESADGNLGVAVYDTIWFTGITIGILAFDVSLQGDIAGPLCYNCSISYTAANQSLQAGLIGTLGVNLGPPTNSTFLQFGSTATSSLNGGNYLLSGTVMLPFTGGILGVSQSIAAGWYLGGGYPESRSALAHLTAQIGNARVYDATGTTLQPGVTFTSDSGFDYTQDFATPEPGSLVLAGLGAATLWMVRRHRVS